MNHQARASARGTGALSHSGVSYKGTLYPHTSVTTSDGQKVNYPNSSQLVLHQNQETKVFNSATSVSGILASSGYADIRIAAGSLQVWRGASLELIITNSSGAACVSAQGPSLAPAQLLIDRVEIYAENGAMLLSRSEGYQALYLNNYRHLDPHAAAMLKSACDMGVSVPANSSTTVYVPLLFTPMEGQFIGHWRGDQIVRVWFRGPSAWATAVVIPTLTSMNLYVQQDHLGRAEYQALMDRGRSSILDLRYNRAGYQVATDNLVAGGRTQYLLSGVHGLVTTIMVTIRLASATGSGLTTFIEGARLEILDSSGATLTNSLPAEYLRWVVASSNSSNSSTEVGPLFIDFTSSIRASLEHGSLPGYVPFSGSEQLVVTMPAGIASASYEVRVDFMAICRLRTAYGQCEVLPS